MTPEHKSSSIPEGYSRIEGSERRPSPKAKFLGAADPKETFTVSIVLRRRPEGQQLPDMESFAAPPGERIHMSREEFEAKHGASPDEIEKVVEFVKSKGLKVVESHAARRTVIASGTAAQMNKAFGVTLGRYQHDIVVHHGEKPRSETYRGREGYVHVPKELSKVIVGVFGLDNRTITKHNSADPPNTKPITVPQVSKLYNYPNNSAAGQTIGIFSLSGYDIQDIKKYFAGLTGGYTMPTVKDILIDGATNPGSDPYGETTQDIDIAASFAPGSAINVYITTGNQKGWVDLINRVIHPNVGDAQCSVLSSSWYISNGDDANTLANEGISTAFLNAVSTAFQDAALLGVTICIASGDTGTDSKVGDGKAHVQYPASDPWVLSVGGTTIGNVVGSSFDEYVWNDTFFGNAKGATGGGISDFFGLPTYQNNAGVPGSINDNHVGRGVPDVAGNASPNSGYSGLFVAGQPDIGNGTSASAPQWAALIIAINAALGKNVGFVNPALYSLGSSVFRDIVGAPGPADNGLNGVAGYPAGPGWDACTGWGSPNGVALLNGLKPLVGPGTITGQVTDTDTGNPIKGATVAAGSIKTTTDSQGNYKLSNVPYGYRSVTASIKGYRPDTEFAAVLGGKNTSVNLELQRIAPICHGAVAKRCSGGEPVVCPNPRYPM